MQAMEQLAVRAHRCPIQCLPSGTQLTTARPTHAESNAGLIPHVINCTDKALLSTCIATYWLMQGFARMHVPDTGGNVGS